MSIKAKLILALSILAIITALGAALIWTFAREQNALLENANARLIKEAEKTAILNKDANDLHYQIVQVQQYLTDAVVTRDNEDAGQSVDLAGRHAQEFLIRLKSVRLNAQELGLDEIVLDMDGVDQDFAEYRGIGADMISAYAAKDSRRGYLLMRQFDEAAHNLGIRLDRLDEKAKLRFSAKFAEVGAEIDKVAGNSRSLVKIVVGMFTLSLVLILTIAVLLYVDVMRPLSGMAAVMTKLARGDLDVAIPVVTRGDEVGDIAQALEVFRSSQSEKRTADIMRTMLNKMPIGVLVCQRDGSIRFANAYARNMLDMKAIDAREFSISQFLPDIKAEDDPELELAEALDKGPFLQSKRADGREFMSEVQVSVMDEEGRYLWTVRDATRRIESDKEREQLEAELRNAQKLESLGTLAGGIAHELNTPIQFVTDNMNFLKDAIGDQVSALAAYRKQVPAESSDDIDTKFDLSYVAEETPQAIQQSLEGLERISEIVLAIKRFSHPSSSDLRDNDLNEIVKTAATVSRNQWKYVADLDLDLDPNLPMVPSNAGELNQMMLNLIVNAAHAIEDKIDTGQKGTIKISTRLVDQCVECAVSDTGVGIKPENRDKIFDLFFTTKAPGRGTGQGLSLVHSIVTRSHRGKIRIDSEVGKGTTFTVVLPLSRTDGADAQAA